MSCLEEDVIEHFSTGSLSPETMVGVSDHARSCAECRQRLVQALHVSLTHTSALEEPLWQPTPRTASASVLAAGTPVGRYTILTLVGRGGMGEVYAAYDPRLDRRVALKLIHAEGVARDEQAQNRLLHEAKAIASLSHANVVVVHDAGTFGERVFLAMEYLEGETLSSWRTRTGRTWKEVLRVHLEAAQGLWAAHRAGIVHRDFKPQNVMVCGDGPVRVMDFGLARRLDGSRVLVEDDPLPRVVEGAATDLTLTRTGERLGTPRYMAPEQFSGDSVDVRTDQFSFCVALYEALYDQHPFDASTFLTLSSSVSRGAVRPAPANHDVPGWLRRILLRGLARRPQDRYSSMAELVLALEADPALRRRRIGLLAGLVVFAVASLAATYRLLNGRRAELDGRIASALEAATRGAQVAKGNAGAVRALRAAAFEALDSWAPEGGEDLWSQARPRGAKTDALYLEAERLFERAKLLDPTRNEARDRLADTLLEHIEFADELGLADRRPQLLEELAANDVRGAHLAALAAPGTIDLRVRPAGVSIGLERFMTDPATDRRAPTPAAAIPRGVNPLAPGSYRLVLDGPGLAPVLAPFLVGRAETVLIDITVPPLSRVPAGFAYVPRGAFLYGDNDERLRTGFLEALPLHRRTTDAYLIARHETTNREWIAFLEGLPPAERRRHAPRVPLSSRGSVELRESARGWEFLFQSGPRRYQAREGQPFIYAGRGGLNQQDWLDFPVSGVSLDDATRYLEWLRATGRVPHARLCTDLEWERAARGADDRVFPHGDRLRPGDANFDQTYGRVDTAYGPDAVGSHAISRSPFGIDDLAGNVLEFVTSSQRLNEIVVRGGAYFFESITCRSTNREVVARTFHDVVAGLRVCASPQE